MDLGGFINFIQSTKKIRGNFMLKRGRCILIFLLMPVFLSGFSPFGAIKGKETQSIKGIMTAQNAGIDELRRRIDSLESQQEELIKRNLELKQGIQEGIERNREVLEELEKKEQRMKKEMPAAKGDMKIVLLNGCGKKGMAARLKTFLEKRGFPVASTGNADNFKYKKSLVYYREAFKQRAIDIAHKIPGWQDIHEMKTGGADADILIIIGRDLSGKI